MSDFCREFREEWLRFEGADEAHARLCAPCTEWLRSTEMQVRALGGLERLSAPAELDALLAGELGGDRSARLVRTLGSLARLASPSILDERLDEVLGEVAGTSDEERRGNKARVASTLDVHTAPHVLERLLDEELRAQEGQRVARFSGSLKRLHAPASLDGRLRSAVRRKALLRIVLGPLATVAAAGLVVWLSARQDVDAPRERRFQVIQATSLEGLDPMARALAEALGGGATSGGVR